MDVFLGNKHEPVPREVELRYKSLYSDLNALKVDGFLPDTVQRAVDAGYGSGAGMVALKQLYPGAEVVGIDNESTQQSEIKYRVRSLLQGFTTVHGDICNPAFSFEKGDLVLASRFPIIWVAGPRVSEQTENLIIAGRILALAKLVADNGTLALAYDSEEDPDYLSELQALFNFNLLFKEEQLFNDREYGDEWMLLAGRKSLSVTPEQLVK